MKAYYNRRAPEYDDWYTGAGVFSSRVRPGWDEDLAALVRLVAGLSSVRTLDLGCGTGYLTRHLRGPVVGCDQSAAMLAQARVQAPEARLVQGDALALPFADAAFERLFTAHLYGHVPPDESAGFLNEARAVACEIVVVDAGPGGGPARDEWQERVLRDGSRHRVYKRFFTGASLAAELGGLVLHDGHWFVAVVAPGGAGLRASAPQQGFGD